MGHFQRRAAGSALAAGFLLLASCRPARAPEIETADQLTRAIEKAGVAVADTALLPALWFGSGGRVIQVGQSLVQVIEFESPEARAAASEEIASDGLSLGGEPLVWTGRPNIWARGWLIVVYVGTDGGTILLLSGLLGDPITAAPPAIDEPYPPAVTAALVWLAQEQATEPGNIDVLEYQPADWPDACLGLPAPGEDCAETPTPGWSVRLQYGEVVYELRTDAIGGSVRR